MYKKVIFVLSFVVFFQVAYSQKVALVLSGGGAKATAHIGVLKALEENSKWVVLHDSMRAKPSLD